MKTTHYVFATGFGGGYLRFNDAGKPAYGNEFGASLDKATRFETVQAALTALQKATRRWGNEVGSKGDSILSGNLTLVRVDEVTTPGTKTLSLSSTLEPQSPTDRFVVITREGWTPDKKEIIASGQTGHGTFVRDLNSASYASAVQGASFRSQLAACGAAHRLVLQDTTFVGIRRLIISEGAPTTKTTTTVLA